MVSHYNVALLFSIFASSCLIYIIFKKTRIDISTKLTKLISNNDIITLKKLLDKGLDPNSIINTGYLQGKTLLMLASICGYRKIVKLLLDYGAEINQKDNNGLTALHWAVSSAEFNQEEKQIPIIKEIIASSHIHVEARDNNNKKALDIAKHHNFKQISALLSNAIARERGLKKVALDSASIEISPQTTLNFSKYIDE